MDDETIHHLNAINRAFYVTTARPFSKTRSMPWPGWEELLPYVIQMRSGELHVLDVGCGNGRFGVFLADQLDVLIDYHGMDNNPPLLFEAREAVVSHSNMSSTRLEERDVVLSPPDSFTYDLVVAFGLIHHIPGYKQRQAFIRRLAQRVKPGGLLVFSSWRFYDHERFRKRIIPWSDDLKDRVQKHDYLLDWRQGARAIRYCHYVDNTEQQVLNTATNLEMVRMYCADGFNTYSVLRNTNSV